MEKNEKRSVEISEAAILVLILGSSFLASIAIISQKAGAENGWKITPVDTNGDGKPDLDIRKSDGQVHLDLNRNGKIDEGEPVVNGVTKVRGRVTEDGLIIEITRIADPEAEGGTQIYRKQTYRVKDKNKDGDTEDEGECIRKLSEGGSSTKFIDPTYDLIDIATSQRVPPEQYLGYLDVTVGEMNKTEDKLMFSLSVNGGIPSLNQSTFWTILMDENNDPADNCMDYPNSCVDTMYSLVLNESTLDFSIKRAKYETWGWETIGTNATWAMVSAGPDGNVTIRIWIPVLELDEFQGILTWKVITFDTSNIGDMGPDWGSVTLALGLGPPKPRIVGELDGYTIWGENVSVEAIEMTPSVDRYDISSCLFEYRAYGNETWNLIGSDSEPVDGWRITWDISGLSEGKYIVRAIMRSILNMTGWTDTTVFYDSTPPTPKFVDPKHGWIIEGLSTIEVETLDENVLFTEFFYVQNASSKAKNIPPVKQKRADDCGAHAAAACLSYWRDYTDKNSNQPFKGLLRENNDQERSTMAEDLYERVGKKIASADALVKAINDHIAKKGVQGLKAQKTDKKDWDTAKREFDRCQDVLLLLCYPDGRCHWVTLRGHEKWKDEDGKEHILIDLMDPASSTGELSGELKDGKICHPGATPDQEERATIEDIVIVCPEDVKNQPDDPFLGTDFDGSDGWSIQWETTEIQDGPYVIMARMVDEDENEQISTIPVYVNNHPTDLNKDRKIDILDIVEAAIAYASTPIDSRWNMMADINRNGIIDICDLVTIARDFGQTY